MKRIINVANIDPAENAGGLNLMVKSIISEQQSLGVDTSLLYFSSKEQRVNTSFKCIIYSGIIDFIKSVSDRNHYVFHSIYNIKYIFFMLAIVFLGSSYSIHAHGSLSKHCLRKSIAKNLIYRVIIYVMIFFSKKIIFANDSEFLFSIVKNKNKILFIPNLIKDNFFPGVVNVNRKKIIYIGKIDYYYKGLDKLTKALSFFYDGDKNQDYITEIYGFGNKKNIVVDNIDSEEKDIIRLLNEIKRYNLQENVKFLGPITGREKFKILSSAGVFILTSNSEAMPLSISEALSCGVPVIITKQTNMSEYVEKYNAGIVCDNNELDIFKSLQKYQKEFVPCHKKYENNSKMCFSNELHIRNIRSYIECFLKCIN